MAKFVDPAWVSERLEDSNYLVLDPRRPMKYLSGHLRNAINLPVFKAFDADLRLLSPESLATWIGAAGLDDKRSPIIYDSFDGQNGAMLAWILEYLGRAGVYLMHAFYERWVDARREVFYKPVDAIARTFRVQLNPSIRITADQIQSNPSLTLLDTRSFEEFNGTRDMDGRPGHIPGSRHIMWRDLIDGPEGFLAKKEHVAYLLDGAGVKPGDAVVSYCRSGLRASVGYLTLKELGYNVVLYDGSYHDWISRGLPVENAS